MLPADIEAHELVRHAKDLRDCWQGKVLGLARGNDMLAVTSMLAHTFDDAMGVLLRVVAPRCWNAEAQSLRAPFLTSIAKVDKRGRVVADVIDDDGARLLDVGIYRSTGQFQDRMRRLADRARLTDQERAAFFICAKAWIAADRRLDPTMDPADPDAKRLVN